LLLKIYLKGIFFSKAPVSILRELLKGIKEIFEKKTT
tara:strand:+ start:28264 stop:28374 length:111 start_codon:yes stop_codon:yes gene_type:complete